MKVLQDISQPILGCTIMDRIDPPFHPPHQLLEVAVVVLVLVPVLVEHGAGEEDLALMVDVTDEEGDVVDGVVGGAGPGEARIVGDGIKHSLVI